MGILTQLRGLLPQAPPPLMLVPNVASATRLNYAIEIDKAGRWQEAAAICWSMIELDSGEVGAAIALGDIWIRHGLFYEAAILLGIMVDKHPDVSALWCNLSAALSELKDHEKALVAANKAVGCDNSNSMAFYNRAECLCAMNQTRLAIRDFEIAVKLDPTNMEIKEKLELAHIAIQEKVKQPFGNVKYERKGHGVWLVDGIEVAETLQCPHCPMHFPSLRDPLPTQMLCFKCMALTCGKPECVTCSPYVRQLEEAAKKAQQSITG